MSGTYCLIAWSDRQDDSNSYVFAGLIVRRDLPGLAFLAINGSACLYRVYG